MSLVAYASSDDDSENEDISVTAPKKREPVKISIPSLKEFKEENDSEKTKKPQPKAGCGLFSILPPPKNSVPFSKPGFTPHVISKKKEIKTPPQASHQKQIKPTVIVESSVKSHSSFIDDPDDSSENVDFFSLGKKPSEELTSCLDHETLNDSASNIPILPSSASIPENQFLPEVSPGNNVTAYTEDGLSAAGLYTVYSPNETAVPDTYISPADSGPSNSGSSSEAAFSPDFFKDERFLKLKGRRGMEDIDIIDVNADDQLTGKDEWLMQSLTEEKVQRPSKRRHDMPTQQQKRKHQITYLAFQAKERELDLKNQWALNSRTRRETQAKYGF